MSLFYGLPLNIVIAGVGGQGNVLCSQLIAWAGMRRGYYATIGETYGASQRGGSVMSHVRLGEERLSPLTPLGGAQVLLGLEPVESLRVGARYLNPDSAVIMNTRPVYPVGVMAGRDKYPPLEELAKGMRKLCRYFWTLNAAELADAAGSALSLNVAMLGGLAATALTPIGMQELREIIKEKTPRLKEVNLNALELGFEAIRKTAAVENSPRLQG